MSAREPRPASRLEQSAWMVTSGAFQAAVAFAGNLVLVRHVGAEGFGRWALAMAQVGLVLSFLSLRPGVQILRMRTERFDRSTRELWFTAILVETALAGLVSAAWLHVTGLLDAASACLLAALLVRHVATNARAFFEREEPYRALALVEGGAFLGGHVLAVVLVLSGAGALALYARELALSLLVFVGLRSVGGLAWIGVRRVSFAELRDLFRRSRGPWADGLLEGAFERLVVLLAGVVGGTAGAGYLYQARALAQAPHRLLAPVAGRLSFNWFSRAPTDAARRRARGKLLGGLAAPLIVLATVTLLWGRDVVPWLLGETWRPASELLVAMVGVVLFTSLFAPLKTYLYATGRTRLVLVARGAQYLGLGLPFLVNIDAGPRGVALGLSAARALAFATALLLTLRADRVHARRPGKPAPRRA